MATIKIRVKHTPNASGWLHASGWLKDYHGHTFDAWYNDDSNTYTIEAGSWHGKVLPSVDVMEIKVEPMQIYCNDPGISEAMQQMLFSKGCMWASYGPNGDQVQHRNSPYLLVDDYGRIRHSQQAVNDLPIYMPMATITYHLEKASLVGDDLVCTEAELAEAITYIRKQKGSK